MRHRRTGVLLVMCCLFFVFVFCSKHTVSSGIMAKDFNCGLVKKQTHCSTCQEDPTDPTETAVCYISLNVTCSGYCHTPNYKRGVHTYAVFIFL